jgi:hypothetical protein
MVSGTTAESVPASGSPLTSADVAAILREGNWLKASSEFEDNPALEAWLARAAELLGPHASDREALAGLLALFFTYDAATLVQQRESQAVIVRSGAREVIRELANRMLDGGEVDSDRFKEIIEGIKSALPYRSRALFQPIRLALAGRAGEGELDRVILLLDAAARLNFAVPVKGTRQRMLEFCAALD